MILDHDAIILAGGRGERLGGRDKALLEVGGRSLLDRVLDATAAARGVVVVEPERPGVEGVGWALEDPPGGGPSAGIVAGLQALGRSERRPRWVLVLAVDQPGAAMVVPSVLRAAESASIWTDGLCPYDTDGYPQWLLSAYRRSSLQRVCERVGSGHGVSVGRLVDGLRFDHVPTPDAVGDIDTWTDHRAWQERLKAFPAGPPG